jgi:hypothetical protein
MLTHVDAQVSALISAFSGDKRVTGLGEHAISKQDCEDLAKTRPSLATENLYSFIFFVESVNSP